MKTYEQLDEEFKAKVAWLQKRCPHAEVSEWVWSSGTAYDGEVKMCKFCGKVMDKRASVTYASLTGIGALWAVTATTGGLVRLA